MIVRKSKLLFVLLFTSVALIYGQVYATPESIPAEPQASSPNNVSAAANESDVDKANATKIVGRSDAKQKDDPKHIKGLEFHRSLNGSAVFEVAFEENISGFFRLQN